MLEKEYQKALIPRIQHRLPGCQITVEDPLVQQGRPDLTVFFNNKRAILEVKRSAKSKSRPNQKYFVENPHVLGAVFGAFIYPENEVEVLNALEQALHP